jgi:hypothetical protein
VHEALGATRVRGVEHAVARGDDLDRATVVDIGGRELRVLTAA